MADYPAGQIPDIGAFRGWLTIGEAAVLVGKSAKTLRNWRSAQRGFMKDSYVVEGAVRVPFDGVIDYLREGGRRRA